MLRKTLVILRVLFFVGPIVYILSTPVSFHRMLFNVFLWSPLILIVFLAFTVWIDRIDARLHPGLFPPKAMSVKSIVDKILFVATVILTITVAILMSGAVLY